MANQSRVSEFLLNGVPETPEVKMLHIMLFLILYLVALTENFLITAVIIYSHQLHTPMYYFLANLSFQDFGSISVTVPKSVVNSLMDSQAISYSGCVCQVFFLVFFMLSHFFLLGVMAYDRYVAICNPLHYKTVMNKRTCIQLATSAWICGLFYALLYTGNAFSVWFCSNVVNQFFCEIPQLLKISCSEPYFPEVGVMTFGACLCFTYLALITFSYILIFREVIRIPSTQGRQKAFSTCLPHLVVISLFMVSGCFAYFKPNFSSASVLDLLVSILYCIVPPVMNPVIYSMRSNELKMAFCKLLVNILPQKLSPVSQGRK
ncbi:olfactory receptor 14A16-like [Varanus komodoensis]|uniref:olfactory receptor 14A16-like n=1 Tax=Varanus komodoensis TaxID=61221 RepID=UPI001CF7DB6A|nr:olfactory receptor 14A16-like [Varanus komodoensis]